MITIEQVEKLRGYGNISFEDARRALEQTEGNMLDAVIMLEKEGKIPPPKQSECQVKGGKEQEPGNNQQKDTENFTGNMKKFAKWLKGIIKKGNTNSFLVTRRGAEVITMPVTILVVLLACFFWVVVPMMVLGIFFDFAYCFKGPNLGTSCVNNAMNNATNCVKNAVKDTENENEIRENTDN